MLTLVACGNLLLLALTNYWDWCFNSTSNIKAIVPLTFAAGTVNVLVSVGATVWLGPIGPALGTLVALGLVVIPWEARLLGEQFEIPLSRVAFAIAKAITCSAPSPFILACRAIARRNPSWSFGTPSIPAALA